MYTHLWINVCYIYSYILLFCYVQFNLVYLFSFNCVNVMFLLPYILYNVVRYIAIWWWWWWILLLPTLSNAWKNILGQNLQKENIHILVWVEVEACGTGARIRGCGGWATPSIFSDSVYIQFIFWGNVGPRKSVHHTNKILMFAKS